MTTSQTPTPTIRINFSTLKKLFLALTLAFSVIYAGLTIFRDPLSPDSWLHMGIGRYIINNQKIPNHGNISFKTTQPSLEWVTHSWLGDTILYLTTSRNERFGPLLLLIPVLLLTLFIANQIFLIYEAALSIRLASLSLLAILSSTFWKIHPLAFTPPLLLLLIYSYLKWRAGRNRFLLAIPVIFLLWANLVGGYIFIPAAFLILAVLWEFFVVPIIAKITKDSSLQTRGRKVFFIISVVGAFAISILNPINIRIYIYGLTLLSLTGVEKWYSTLPGTLEATNTNVFKLTPSPFLYVLFLAYSLITTSFFLILLIRDRNKFLKGSISLIPLIIFFWTGYVFIRFIPLSTFATAPIFTFCFSYLYKKNFFSSNKVFGLISSIGCILLPFIILILITYPPRKIILKPPRSQCNFIRQNELSGNILVSTELTGYAFYCLYPLKENIDAQDDFFDENDTIGIYGQAATIPEDTVKKLTEENGINTILASKENDYLTSYFDKSKDWSLVYIDSNGLIFVKNSSVDPAFIKQNALKYLDLSRNLGFDPENLDKAIAELENFINKHPESELATGQLASLYRFAKKFDKAESTLRRIPERDWGFAILTEMGRIKAAQGLCISSETYYKRALADRNERDLSRTVFEMAILYAGCFNDSAKAKHYFERYISFPLPESERERAIQVARKFVISLDENQ